MLLTEVQTDFGYPLYRKGEGYALFLIASLYTNSSIWSVVIPT